MESEPRPESTASQPSPPSPLNQPNQPNHLSQPSQPTPPTPILDQERERVAERLQAAVGEGRLTLEEYSARVDVVYSAQSHGELDAATADLPSAPIVSTGGSAAAVGWTVNVFGDIKRRGRWRIGEETKAVSVFGDVELDLRETYVRDDEITVRTWNVFGDVRVIVPEGVEVEVSGFGVFGDRRIELAPVPRRPGTPLVKIAAFSLFGDLTVRNDPPTDRLREWVRRALGRDPR